MTKTELNISEEIKKKNGALFYRICSREIIVYQYKALDTAYLKDKIYFKHDLNRLVRRKNKTVIINNPGIKAATSAIDMLDKGKYSFIDKTSMSRFEMILFLHFNQDIKVSHWLFSSDEYILYKDYKGIVDENGYLFEDWYSTGSGMHNGIRMRDSDNWLTGWYVKEDNIL